MLFSFMLWYTDLVKIHTSSTYDHMSLNENNKEPEEKSKNESTR